MWNKILSFVKKGTIKKKTHRKPNCCSRGSRDEDKQLEKKIYMERMCKKNVEFVELGMKWNAPSWHRENIKK